MSVSRRRALLVAAAALLLVGAVVLSLTIVDLSRYRGRVQTVLAERLGRDVSIAGMHVSVLPLGIRLVDGVIGEDAAFRTGRPFARASELYVSIAPLALLRGQIDVRAVELRQPAIELVRSAAGIWNFASLGRRERSGGLVLTHLVVTGGEVAVTNLAARDTRRVVYEHIDLTLDDYVPDRPFHLVLTARLPGIGEPRLSVRGEGGPITKDRIAQASFKGRAEIDAAVKGTADVTLTSNEAVLTNVTAAVGSTKAQGQVTVRNFASPEIDFELFADAIDVAEVQRLLAPARPTTARPEGGGGNDILLRTTGAGRLRAAAIRYNNLLLENVHADARLDRGVIALQPLTASLFGGEHHGAVVVDASQSPVVFTVESVFEKVDASRLVSATTSLDNILEGALDSANSVTFKADGTGNVSQSLNGVLSLTIPTGRIAHLDLMHAIRTLAGLERPDAEQQTTEIRDLRATFTVTNGVAHTDDLAGTIDDDSSIAGSGSINLVNRALDLQLTAVLSREFGDRLGGRRVAGLVSTVLANERGELVVPMLVTGATSQPRVTPDLKRIAQMHGYTLPQNPIKNVRDALRRILAERRTAQPEREEK
jgi:uncharacterized protein involved in outer membrane biogenesis